MSVPGIVSVRTWRTATTVASFIAARGGATQKEIREATNLPRRSIFNALRNLKDGGIIREYPYLRDTRQSFYRVVSPSSSN